MTPCLYCQTLSSLAPFCCRSCELLYQGQFHLLREKASKNHQQIWSAFDKDDVKNIYRIQTSSYGDEYRFYIEGLQCASCVHLLEKLPEIEPQIIKAQTLFGSSELIVTVQKSFPLSHLFPLLEEMGYKAHLLKKGESAQEGWNQDAKKWLKEIAVAGACTGNIMMFIIPVYAGVTDPYRTVFLWLSFFLFLPILIYSAQSIYHGAWRALKTRSLNTDLALTIALWGGFTLSTLNLLRGSNDIYFDSTASFLFLILMSRYFVKKVQRQTLLNLQKQDSFWDASYLKKEGHQWIQEIPSLLKVDDEIHLQKNQILPCDSVLLSAQSEWDTTLLTGEVLPRVYNRQMNVTAGLRLLSDEAFVRVQNRHDDGELQQMLQVISQQSLRKNPILLKMDLWSQRLLLSVFIIGILFFAVYSTIHLEEAFHRTLALWIVACPCALAFAAPLTLYKALLMARQKGMLIKNPEVFEKVKHLKNLIFDKTGTLTSGQLQMVSCTPPGLSQYYKDIVLELEKKSLHPVAFAFRKAWPEGPQMDLQVSDIYEKMGEKVYGLHNGKMYTLSADTSTMECLGIQLLENETPIAHFEFKDELFPNVVKNMSLLQKKFPCYILSGDQNQRVQTLAQDLQISQTQTFGNQTPLQKWNFVKQHPFSLMMGDGANDAAALQEATIGVASHGSLEMSFRVADIYLLKKGVQPLIDFFNISHRYQHVLKRNFMLAITYNCVAGLCALLGFMNPLVAALLMPLSSLILLFSTLEGWS